MYMVYDVHVCNCCIPPSPPSLSPPSQYVLLKLFGERKEEVEAGRVGVLYLMLHGRTATPAEKESLAFLELLVRVASLNAPPAVQCMHGLYSLSQLCNICYCAICYGYIVHVCVCRSNIILHADVHEYAG